MFSLYKEKTANEGKKQKATGFASPALGYEAENFDFNEILVKKPYATFVMRQKSGEMAHRGIFDGSLLVVDRSATPRSGSVVILAHEGRFLCREIRYRDKCAVLASSEREIHAAPEDISIFGVVKAVINQL